MDRGASSCANLLQSSNLLRSSNEYARAVEDYLDHAFSVRAEGDEIACPCKKRYHRFWHCRDEVYDHLIVKGIDPKSNHWHFDEKFLSAMSNQRLKTIEKNKRKMKELGINAHPYEAICSMDQKRQKINKMKSKEVLARDVEYIPDEVCEVEDDNEIMQDIRISRSHSKKVIASRGENLLQTFNKPTQSKTLVAPGSLSACVIKEKLRERLSNQMYASPEDSIQLRADLSLDHEMENLKKRRESYSALQLFDGLSGDKIPKISENNKVIRECQKDRHTTGPVSFARKRHDLEQPANVPPSEATMYRETPKRKPERKYKTCYEFIEHNIMEEVQTQDHRPLSGKCTKSVKGSSKSSMLIHNEFFQTFKAQIVKEAVGELMKILKQVLPSDMLARIVPPDNVVNGQSSSGINDIDQCPNDADRHTEANDHDDLERNDEGIQKEVQNEA